MMIVATRFYFLVFMVAWRASTVVGVTAEPGAPCNNDADCSTNRCFQGFLMTNKVCACNSNTNAGCSEGQICSDDPIAYDGLPECRSQVGDECQVDSDCSTNRCFQGFSPIAVCACNSDTNAGCPEDQICSDDPIAYDDLPECRDPGDGQLGDECQVDADCQSLRCFYGEQLPGTPGTCACNTNSNAGCPEGQICSDDPIAYDGLPECRKPCEIEFILFNADTDEELHPLKAKEYKRNFPFSIEARPNSACPTTRSARMTLSGRINTERTENYKPYAVFGNKNKDFNGRNFNPGAYTIAAELYSQRRLQGDVVVFASFDFVVENDRRLRTGN